MNDQNLYLIINLISINSNKYKIDCILMYLNSFFDYKLLFNEQHLL